VLRCGSALAVSIDVRRGSGEIRTILPVGERSEPIALAGVYCRVPLGAAVLPAAALVLARPGLKHRTVEQAVTPSSKELLDCRAMLDLLLFY